MIRILIHLNSYFIFP